MFRFIFLSSICLFVANSYATSLCGFPAGDGECVSVKPFQPSDEKMVYAGMIYDVGMKGFDFDLYGNSQSTIVVDSVPYARYWQSEDPDKYVFHPMVYGRYVYNKATDLNFQEVIHNITERIGIELPNGGVAFYYPNHYSLNRMRGPDLMYSAISQSESLAGYLRLYMNSKRSDHYELLMKIKDSLFYEYEKGGVNLGPALLEFPLFRSNPEVVLNGWLHALLHLNDYALVMNDKEVARYVEQNLEFFVDNHSVWYDSKRHISRYSDTSPHRVVVNGVENISSINVVYIAKDRRLKNYQVKPVIDIKNEYSGFDVRVNRISNNRITMSLTCSGLFDTYLTADTPFQLKIRDGGYSPVRATPTGSGEWQIIESTKDGEGYSAKIALDDAELICGFPTNFAKSDGKNYYHMQHIIALIYLAKTAAYDNPSLNDALETIALEWYKNNSKFAVEGLSFQDADVVLRGINRGKVLTQITNSSDLF